MRLHRGSLGREHQSRERCTFHSDYGESSSETSSDSFRLSVSGVSGPAESMHYERAAPVRNRSDLPPLAEQSCSRCASVENGSAVVQHLHGGAIYRVHRSTYSVDEQYSGEGCSTERPKTLTRVWDVLLLQQNRLPELRRVLLSGHGRLREEGRKAMKPV
jgi:hypothetical protein